MDLKKAILEMIEHDPIGFRSLFTDADITEACSSIGILLQVLELHAPSINARKTAGLGDTLCGIRGTRHSSVTCKRCLKKMKN
jgi:hypothetical protein